MSEKPNDIDFPQRTGVTDYVLGKIVDYSELRAKTKEKGEEAFGELLGNIINEEVEIKPFERAPNLSLFSCFDKKDEPLPFILKVVGPRKPGLADDIETAHKKYVELLGSEFVEDMTRIKITNPRMVQQILQRYESWEGEIENSPDYVDSFVQDLRGQKGDYPDMWVYIIEHHRDMESTMRGKIITFLQRLMAGVEKGYVFDIHEFPDRAREWGKLLSMRSNVKVDEEGPSFIDSGDIWTKDEKGFGPRIVLSANTAIELLEKKISLDEAFDKMKVG